MPEIEIRMRQHRRCSGKIKPTNDRQGDGRGCQYLSDWLAIRRPFEQHGRRSFLAQPFDHRCKTWSLQTLIGAAAPRMNKCKSLFIVPAELLKNLPSQLTQPR